MKQPIILPLVEFARPICEAEEARGGRPAAPRLAALAARLESDRRMLAELEGQPWDENLEVEQL